MHLLQPMQVSAPPPRRIAPLDVVLGAVLALALVATASVTLAMRDGGGAGPVSTAAAR